MANGQSLAYVYARETKDAANIANVLTEELRQRLLSLRSPRSKKGRKEMIRLLAVAASTLAIATSAHAMSLAPLHQPDGMVTQVREACGAGRVRVNGVCVARTTIRQTRRAYRY